MRCIQLPLKKSVTEFLFATFSIPLAAHLYIYFFNAKKTEGILNGIVFFAAPALFFLALRIFPFFTFKPDEKVKEEKALLKIPFPAFAFWIIVAISFFFAYGGTFSLLENSKHSSYDFLFGGLGVGIPLLLVLNTNTVLFDTDYSTQKQRQEMERRKTSSGHFLYNEDGFEYEIFSAAWVDVECIIAYKTDNFTYDTIRFIIKKVDGTELNLSEDAQGWFVFTQKLEENLSGVDAAWFSKVMLPPFEENATWVYKKGEILGKQD